MPHLEKCLAGRGEEAGDRREERASAPPSVPARMRERAGE
jgi:hypothetical protein